MFYCLIFSESLSLSSTTQTKHKKRFLYNPITAEYVHVSYTETNKKKIYLFLPQFILLSCIYQCTPWQRSQRYSLASKTEKLFFSLPIGSSLFVLLLGRRVRFDSCFLLEDPWAGRSYVSRSRILWQVKPRFNPQCSHACQSILEQET